MSDNADGDADPYHSQTVNSIQENILRLQISDEGYSAVIYKKT